MSELFRRQADLLVLAVLSAGPRHGYGVIEEIRQRSGGRFDLAEGTIYPLLHRLEVEGQVESGWEDAAGRRRRVYRIAGNGLAALAERREDWRRFSLSLNAVIGWAEATSRRP